MNSVTRAMLAVYRHQTVKSGSKERFSHFAVASRQEKQSSAPHISPIPTRRLRRSSLALARAAAGEGLASIDATLPASRTLDDRLRRKARLRRGRGSD